MLGRLLHASTPQSVAAVFVRLGCKDAPAVLQLLAAREGGAAAVAALLQCLSPIVAVRCARHGAAHKGVHRAWHVYSFTADFFNVAPQHELARLCGATWGAVMCCAGVYHIIWHRFLHEMPGYESSLLPAAIRAVVKPLLQPAVADSLQEVSKLLTQWLCHS